ncbi:hypothetical protein B0H10DRAFT_396249 [Mycena sp. CBHHK59/15]|nr:hypothetical protein B0H10DRAFT_396249 [Mycena sp. CBHHK59/15]
MPASLLTTCRWWMGQHSQAQVDLEKLPIANQTDGFSCGMLVDNCLQHFVDPEIALSAPGDTFAIARLAAFIKLGNWTLERVSEPTSYFSSPHSHYSLKLSRSRTKIRMIAPITTHLSC